MGAYVADSTNIVVFPTTKREVNDRKARLLTEQNLVDVVNRLLDVESFVITKNFNINGSFEFNIHGYFIKISNIGDVVDLIVTGESNNGIVFDENTCIYANIHTFLTGDYEELYGSDENGSYDGVIFTLNSPLTNANNKYLKILQCTPTDDTPPQYKWYVPQNSYVKFYATSLLNPIDCGEI